MIFDGKNKLIILENGENEINLKLVYYQWKTWIANPNNLRYPLAFNYVGGDEVQDKTLGLTFILKNGWKIKPSEENQILKVKGNIYTDDKSSPFVKTDGDFNVLIQTEVSNIVDIINTTLYNNNTDTGSITNTTNIESDDNDDWSVSN
jgi:hypothetical protein